MAGRKWTDEEIQFLKDNFEEMSCQEIAEHIGRTTRATQHMFGFLGLERKQPQPGDIFGRLRIDSICLKPRGNQNAAWVECTCFGEFHGPDGKKHETWLGGLVAGTTVSCGCHKSELARQRTIERNYVHGDSNKRIFRVWCNMIARCKYDSVTGHKYYKDKGVKVCEEWLDYLKWKQWALENGYEDNLDIDRKDNDGCYEPSNCRFVTRKANNNNKSNNVRITAFGETKTAQEWSEDPRSKVNREAIIYRVRNDWAPERAITTPALEGKDRRKGEPT